MRGTFPLGRPHIRARSVRNDRSMRVLHTSDWHIGRIWSGVDLLETQRQFGSWLCDLVKSEKIDAVLISGDIYDRAIPNAEAVATADEIFGNLADAGASIVAISGNHDSADRLNFGSRFMAQSGLFIRTERSNLASLGEPIVLASSSGSVEIVCLPFLEPNRVELSEEQGSRTHENVLRVALDHQRTLVKDASRAIVMAHAFVGGGQASDSERELLTVGGTSMVNHHLFDGFGYVALGHLHRPQQFGDKGNVVYSGSPIPYSFSEQHEKSVVILDTETMTSRKVPVGIGRGVTTITGELADILRSAEYKHAEQMFVRIELTDEKIQIGAMERVRERFPYTLDLRQRAVGSSGTIEELVGGKARSIAEEVGAYMEQYFPLADHPFKHELANKAVATVATSDEG